MQINVIKSKLPGDGWKVEALGKYKGLDAFQAYIPEGVTGFPFVFLLEGDKIKKEITGFNALDIIDELTNT